ncbi:hypothetical protein [Leptolyngbya sp. FACHB-261]|uniref:slr1601 family putative cell division protein n=1 Tax=Leptolyngbya sp. FACHB-261 TaxID=2692806 RepID=UPI0016835CD0|nr:hypothetical protein [Leptolyngbya sp. FACHB-261]MBD2101329.1 hypothetical protein [Leptolyngbya sp. FACHB-261]
MVARRRPFQLSWREPHAAQPAPRPLRNSALGRRLPATGLKRPQAVRPSGQAQASQASAKFQPGLLLVPPQPSTDASRAARLLQAQRNRRYRARGLEAVAAIAVNLVLAASACYALVQLFPYQLAQQKQLHEISNEVKTAQQRVKVLRERLTRNFDPTQTEAILREQGLVNPNQVQVELISPKWDDGSP